MALPESFLDELRSRIPLGALVGRRVRLTRSGRSLKGLCPFHAEKTPSFHVVEDKGFFHCFGCGAHGDAIGFVMRTEGLSFLEAVERLAGEAGLAMPRPSPEAAAAAERVASLYAVAEAAAAAFARRLRLPEGRAALAYLHQRGVSDESIAAFGLGWSGEGRGAIASDLLGQGVSVEQLVAVGLMRQEGDRPPVDLFFNRVMFPIRDRRGRVIGFGGRVLGDGQPKYLNSPETALFAKRRALYGIDLAARHVRSGAELLVVEGYLDVISLHQAGFGGAVAPLGTALTADHLAELWRLAPTPLLCFDGDAAGARAALRTAEQALPLITASQSLAIALLPQGEDPDTLVRGKGQDGVKAVLERRRCLADALFETVAATPGRTPEERVAIRRRLDELANRITDRALREEYRRHFRDRWFAAVRAGKSGGRGGAAAAVRPLRPVLAPERTRALREREVLALLLAHPWLLAEAEEPLATVRFDCPPCEQIRAALVAGAATLAGLDTDQLVDHLRGMGLAEALEAVLGRRLSDLPPMMLQGAGPEEVRCALSLAFGRLDPERLEREVAEASARLANDFSETNVRRVTRLIAARERLRGEVEWAAP